MNIDDAVAFIVDFIKNPRRDEGHGTYGYELYMPHIIAAYIIEIELSSEHRPHIFDSQHARDLSPVFFEAAWELCRRGVLRPGIRHLGGQGTADGASGYGYSVTTFGRQWIQEGALNVLLVEPGRLGLLFKGLSAKFGAGFLQRSNEAVRCYQFGTYLACCAMCGAAVESVILSVAVTKSGDEPQIMALYRGAQGRRKLLDVIVGKARQPISEPFRTATGLLSYWRDEASHGLASTITEIEAHEALARLIRFAQFSNDNWAELTS